MELKLLRMDIDDAKNDPDPEKTDFVFWVSCYHFELEVHLLKTFFSDERIKKLTSENCEVAIRLENSFLFQDEDGYKEVFTLEEAKLLLEAWEKAQVMNANANIIYYDPTDDQLTHS